MSTLDDVCRRIKGLEEVWREGQSANIRKCLEEAASLPERQQAAQEALRTAEAELARVTPDATPSNHAQWREAFGETVRCGVVLAKLAAEERSLWLLLSVELWHARIRHWELGVASANQRERPK
ncbi:MULTISPECIES: hypothetical protein [Myxococcus]|uniref:hypothetical protein n=1 Tax=Myxococcus TaxID=32 RepID=UPI00114227F6|nr:MULTISPECIES: hypothetical protein [Myxococcus]NOK05788.1 hypothetical protein [Myxococcus xanthus]